MFTCYQDQGKSFFSGKYLEIGPHHLPSVGTLNESLRLVQHPKQRTAQGSAYIKNQDHRSLKALQTLLPLIAWPFNSFPKNHLSSPHLPHGGEKQIRVKCLPQGHKSATTGTRTHTLCWIETPPELVHQSKVTSQNSTSDVLILTGILLISSKKQEFVRQNYLLKQLCEIGPRDRLMEIN